MEQDSKLQLIRLIKIKIIAIRRPSAAALAPLIGLLNFDIDTVMNRKYSDGEDIEVTY